MRNDVKWRRWGGIFGGGFVLALPVMWVGAPLLPLTGTGAAYRRAVVLSAFVSGTAFATLEYYPWLREQLDLPSRRYELLAAAFIGVFLAFVVPLALLLLAEMAGFRGQYGNALIGGYVTGAVPAAYVAVTQAVWTDVGPATDEQASESGNGG